MIPPYKVIHIAGSKGKGTTATLLAKLFELKGCTVGLFTSPHLFEEQECIQVNGELINGAHLEELKHKAGDMSDFEALTWAAAEYFKEKACDYAVFECGWGGQRDATNLIENKVLTILTHVELEHVGILGNSLEEITLEKLGICRPGVPLLTPADQDTLVLELAEHACEKVIPCPRIELGQHHPNAVGLALSAADALEIEVTEAMRMEIADLQIPGRFEVHTWKGHTLILDGAHTPDSVHDFEAAVRNYIEHESLEEPLWCLHFLSDKDPDLWKQFPRHNSVWIPLDEERAGQNSGQLPQIEVDKLFAQLEQEHDKKTIVFVGSFRLVAAVKKFLN
jgi:dihydrofolate synthase/folylpolyglutamate synthase